MIRGDLIKEIDVDITRRVAKVSMKLVENKFLGLRLIDQSGDYIVNITWDTWLDNRWTSFSLEEGQEIIGIQCYIGNLGHISRLGFLVWTPQIKFKTSDSDAVSIETIQPDPLLEGK